MSPCPRCGEPLRSECGRGVVVDACQACGGLWLDAGELKGIIRGIRGDTPAGTAPATREPLELAGMGGSMRCPACPEEELVPFVYAQDSGIELDRCPRCDGLWLDDGELERIERKVAVSRWRPRGGRADRTLRDGEARSWVDAVVKFLMREVSRFRRL